VAPGSPAPAAAVRRTATGTDPTSAAPTSAFAVPELLSFISVDWIKPLAKRLRRIWEKRNAELAAISNTFGDPRPLASCYIEPRVQHHNPTDHHEDEDAISYVRAPAFETINRFLSGDTPVGGGQTKLFILSDAGMGKTSLLLMLKLAHLFSF
jgi:hypothetical protein